MNQPMRRSMSAALQTVELPPEAIALIKEGSAKPMSTPPALVEPTPEKRSNAVLEPEEAEAPERPRPAKLRTPREKPEPMPVLASIVSMTIRVPVELPNALLRVSVERKLQRQRPFTQQEMVATAIREWLRRNGYADMEQER